MSALPRALPPARPVPPAPAPLWQALGPALGLEAAAVAAVLIWLGLHPAAAPLRVLPLEIESALAPRIEPPRPAPPPPPLPTPPRPSITPRPTAPMRPAPAAAPAAVAPSAPLSSAPSELAAVPAAPAASPVAPAPAPASPPAPPPPPAAPAGPSPEYVAKVRAAVQAAFVYPPAAVAADFHGRTRVGFTLRGSTPSNARVLVGSGMGLVDRAALQSVQSATYPPPPESGPAEAHFEIWVEFRP